MARILVVDDEEGVRTFVAEALAREGHAVRMARDGLEAKALLAREGVDLVVTDLKMPGLDGMGLLERVKQDTPDVEVIVLTAHGTIENAVAAMKAGAFDYLTKPIGSPAELRLVAARALERRRLVAWQTEQKARTDAEPTLTWGAPAMASVVTALRKVAATTANVLLTGESGTGKEVAARAVHLWSARRDGPFVAVNCAALSETLLESELFGHEKGAFTGAVSQRRGRLELAEGGTFFLDEVGELKAELQAKLLRVLQERTFERVGGTRTLEADVRVVAATNRDLKAMISRGEFREDLYHRLAVFPVRLPPLRERREDIAPLAQALLRDIAGQVGRPGLRLSDEAVADLQRAGWPGNARELRNVLERAAILTDGDLIGAEVLGVEVGAGVAPALVDGAAALPSLKLDELERLAITRALEASGGNRKRAAELLGIGLRTLYEKLKKME